ncbi:MAG: hypothetical protein JXP34_00095 [Planctomycetes bacterium]|nr:hypothetical protein [Planctomycetota bacterium]
MSFLSGRDAVHLLRRPVPGAAPSRTRRSGRRQVLGSEDLVAELREYVAGQQEREDLLPRIWFPGFGRLGRECCARRDRVARIERARALLAVILNDRFISDPRRARTLSSAILGAIDGDRPLPVRSILRKVYGISAGTALSTRPGGPQRAWADVAYLAPFRLAAGHMLRGADWFVALSVVTAALWGEGLGGDAEPRWPDPLDGAVEETSRLRRKARSVVRARGYRYFVDRDGLAHAVFAAEQITEIEIRQAVRLFAVDNRLRNVSLDGCPIAVV